MDGMPKKPAVVTPKKPVPPLKPIPPVPLAVIPPLKPGAMAKPLTGDPARRGRK
jgi:hypothetical protein